MYNMEPPEDEQSIKSVKIVGEPLYLKGGLN